MSEVPQTYGKITLRPYQHEAHTAALLHAREQVQNWKKDGKQPEPAIIDAYVGAGKTLLIGAMAAHCTSKNLRMLILARQGELVEQNAEECLNMGAPCSVYSASLNAKSTHYKVVAGTEGTVANALDTDFAEWLPTIIMIDEAHMLDWQDFLEGGTTQYSKILRHFNQLADQRGIFRPIVIGLTGSPYRGTESIIGPDVYWRKKLCDVGRKFLVDNGFLVPTIFGFGHDEVQYHFDGLDKPDEVGTGDYTASQLQNMHAQIEPTQTELIMREVVELTRDRHGVMITCAGRKHCEEAASYLPRGTWGIVTQDTGNKDRREILKKAKSGEIKYLLQVGCLTTGINIPLIDTSVILRRIGSLTLLVQLLGRGMRLLKPEQEAEGLVKVDHLVLDYAGTMGSMAQLFSDPILEDAQLAHAKEAGDTITCPKCQTINSMHARRCIGPSRLSQDGRCEHFWKSRTCDDHKRGDYVIRRGCGAENDVAARECRICHNTLIDPNEKLSRTHYRDDDWRPVLGMDLEVTGKAGDGVKVTYHLDNVDEEGHHEKAVLHFWAIHGGGKQIWRSQFVNRHVNGRDWQERVMRMRPSDLIKNKAILNVPTSITHRVNENGKSVVHGLRFRTREFMGAKQNAIQD